MRQIVSFRRRRRGVYHRANCDERLAAATTRLAPATFPATGSSGNRMTINARKVGAKEGVALAGARRPSRCRGKHATRLATTRDTFFSEEEV